MTGRFLEALALVLVIEGFAYALFPSALKRLMARALATPEQALRTTGVVVAAVGVAALWFLRG